jgi:protease-4
VWIVPTAVIGFLVFALGMGFIALVVNGGDSASGPRVGIVELSGIITDAGEGGALSRVPGARDVIEDLDRAGRDSTVQAVVLRINSPGGSPAASQEMYRAVKKLAAKKPVICSMGDVAASGGYYVAAACDEIYANGSTITGSIGVISQFLNYGALAKKLGVDTQTMKSGEFKDAGNPARPLTPRERQLFQTLIRDIYNQFVDDVAAGRKGKKGAAAKLTRAKIVQLADGRVYTGRQAQANGLIDTIGGLEEAVAEAAQLAKIEGVPRVKNFSKGAVISSLFGAESSVHDGLASAANGVAASAGDAAGRAFVASLKQETHADAGAIAPQMR